MYLVQLYSGDTFVLDKTFPFGEWAEIGLWLDDHGYNTGRYHLQVRFIEV